MNNILIAGVTSGIGKSIAELLLNDNKNVIGLGRNHNKYKPDLPNYFSYTIDFSNIEILENELKNIIKNHEIDALICSAGFGDFAELEQFSVERMTKLMNVNFMSQAILIKNILPKFKKQNHGKIVVIGSECALEGNKKGSIYCATKFALRGFIQSIRKECSSKDIAITLINPGLVDTPFFDALDFAPASDPNSAIVPEQIASLIHHLLLEKNNCVYEEINLQPLRKRINRKERLIT